MKINRLATWSLFFPAFFLFIWIVTFVGFIKSPGIVSFLFFLFWVYLFPPLFYQFLNSLFKIHEIPRISSLSPHEPSNRWIVGHRCQVLFDSIPVLERVLRLYPGLYSCWLSLWGSQVGKNVYWTPHLLILDRTHLYIGNDCIFGDQTCLTSHLVKPVDGEPKVLFEPIRLGDRVFIGGQSFLGPGVNLEPNQFHRAFSLFKGKKKYQYEIVEVLEAESRKPS